MANPPRFFPAVPIPAMPEREVSSFMFTQTKRGREKHLVRLCFKHRDNVFHALEGALWYGAVSYAIFLYGSNHSKWAQIS
jgi:hypothetical protein